MGYEVTLRRTAQRELDAVSRRDFPGVANAISGLERNPRPRRVKKLGDSGLWRMRVGRYRIVYAVDNEARCVTIVRVARRTESTYRRL